MELDRAQTERLRHARENSLLESGRAVENQTHKKWYILSHAKTFSACRVVEALTISTDSPTMYPGNQSGLHISYLIVALILMYLGL